MARAKLLENIESNIIIDRCDVFYSEDRINLTVSVKDYKGISDENLMKSFVKREIEDKELLFTPLHPLNIAYQLHLLNCIDDETMADEVLKKFTSTILA